MGPNVQPSIVALVLDKSRNKPDVVVDMVPNLSAVLPVATGSVAQNVVSRTSESSAARRENMI